MVFMSWTGPWLSWCGLEGCFSKCAPKTLHSAEMVWEGLAGEGEHLCIPERPRVLTAPWAPAGGGREDISEQHIHQHIYPCEAAGANGPAPAGFGINHTKQAKSGTQK